MDRMYDWSRTTCAIMWVLPAAVLLLLLAGHVWVWRSARALTYELAEQTSANAAEQVSFRLGLQLYERSKDAAHLASLWRNYPPEVRDMRFTTDARGIVSRESDFRSIGFMDTLGRIRLLIPEHVIPAISGVNIDSVLRSWRSRPASDTAPILIPEIGLPSGERVLLFLVPVSFGGVLQGFVAPALHLPRIIEKASTASLPPRYRLSISVDGKLLHAGDSTGHESEVKPKDGCAVRTISALGRSWSFTVVPPAKGAVLDTVLRSNLQRFVINAAAAAIAAVLLAVALRASFRERNSRQMLALSEQRYRRLAENARDVIFRMSLPDGRFEYVSPASKELLGYAPEEFYANSGLFREIIDPLWREYYDRQWGALLQGDAPPTYEYRITHRNGESRWMYQRNVVVYEAPSTPRAIEAMVTDITEQKNVAEERERLIHELEAKNADLERFTYTVSHELKTPLVTIRGFLGYLEQEAATGDLEQLHDDLGRIRTATETMRRQLSDLIELTRVGRNRGEPEAVDMTELAHRATDFLAETLRENLTEVHIEEGMPPVLGYRSELFELYKNLIENAAKFTRGTPNPRIDIGFRPEDGRGVFFVRDSGIGIDPRYQERIFGLFNKLDPHSEGTGVGLALARRIAAAHGGWIRVSSAGLGKGSLFYFDLPLAPQVRS